ncbi:AraC family transcriptional regulator [Nitratireductor sp. ZSWI3]|uniref:helix-turn-helix transcriptional regulator n=1 Tax=Nitratireductor sp. ZSWI3 TaxID=2966359 RepID=UPI0021500DFC|nr:helix-turn-helix domain-containing protein [Nitratireductor sp. ZSWI3]MCR4264897.1 helix-turn-helix domain-containing protein [Nitratireductor sp. ZSWI3]
MLPAPSAGLNGPGPGLFTYCAFAHERLADVRLPQPAVGVVLDGRKEIWLGDRGTICRAGSAFIVPADTAMTVYNVPGESHGLYRSLVIELADITPPEGGASTADTMCLTMTEPLRASLLHAAQALAQGPAAPAVRNARLSELVALIAHDPAGAWLGRASVSVRLKRLLSSAPGEDWTVGAAAERLAMAGSTLRRRLLAEGTSFREILRTVRLDAADRILAAKGSVAEAAAAVGLSSRGHFAQSYRDRFGQMPSERRRMRQGGHF